jgi:hypothetical protein
VKREQRKEIRAAKEEKRAEKRDQSSERRKESREKDNRDGSWASGEVSF